MRIRILLILLLLCSVVNAQRRRVKAAPKVTTTIADVDSLMRLYRFEEASTALQTLINQAAKKNEPTEELEQKAEKIRIGANMLSATAEVVFVDSFVVDKSNILSVLKLDKSNGSLDYWKNIFELNQGIGKDVQITTTYINDFKDKLFYCYPDSTGHTTLFCRYMIDSKWSAPEALGIGDDESDEAYPFVLSDGLTLYYSSLNTGNLGGYDIYVTRYNTDTGEYLKPENLGMPYNSLYNDYLMAIDEANNLGWLVSDRFQPEGKVCIYLFIPNETRNVYAMDTKDGQLCRLAMIHDIAASQHESKNDVIAAKQRYKDMLASLQKNSDLRMDFTFHVYNGIVYHSLDEFKSTKARQIAENWKELNFKRKAIMTELAKNRKKLPSDPSLHPTVVKQENALEQLDDTIKEIEWNIRYEEQIKLNIYNK